MDIDSLRYADAEPKRFSRTELRDLVVSVAVLSMAFMLMFRNTGFVRTFFEHYLGSLWAAGMFGLMVLIVILSFILHELGHKFTAQKMGLWSEYRMFPMGLLIALALSFAGFLFAAPGVVYIKGFVTGEQDGRISLAGPLVNIVLALVGLAGCFALNGDPMIVPFYLLFTLNASLAFFNLLPIGILDGSKIMRWNMNLWVMFFAVSLVLFGSRFLGFFDFYYTVW